MAEPNGEQEDSEGLFRHLDVRLPDTPVAAAGRDRANLLTTLAVAGHLAAGGWIIIVEPWRIIRAGREPEIEMRAVGIVQGR